MTDTTTPQDGVNASIRAELARLGYTTGHARSWLGLGETAWRARMDDDGNWKLRELRTLAERLRVSVVVLVENR